MTRLIYTIVLLFASASGLMAQENAGPPVKRNNISVAPAGVINKFRLRYEYLHNTQVSYGAYGSYYYGLFPGFKAEPFIRFFPDAEAPEGLYMQFNLAAGYHWYHLEEKVPTDIPDSFKSQKSQIAWHSLGLGIQLGNQWIFGRYGNFSVDASVGLQYYHLPQDIVDRIKYSGANSLFLDKFLWYFTGPGAVVTPRLCLGYRF